MDVNNLDQIIEDAGCGESPNAMSLDLYLATIAAGAEAARTDADADLHRGQHPTHSMPPEGTLAQAVWMDGYRGHRDALLAQITAAQEAIQTRRDKRALLGLRAGWLFVSGLAVASLFILIWW